MSNETSSNSQQNDFPAAAPVFNGPAAAGGPASQAKRARIIIVLLVLAIAVGLALWKRSPTDSEGKKGRKDKEVATAKAKQGGGSSKQQSAREDDSSEAVAKPEPKQPKSEFWDNVNSELDRRMNKQ